MELELTEFPLTTAIEDALMLVRERAGLHSLTLQTNIEDRLGEIQTDESKVRQVVLNLLSDATKFTAEDGRIDVGAVPKDGLVEMSAGDTGTGIAPEDQERVFEEFRQVGVAGCLCRCALAPYPFCRELWANVTDHLSLLDSGIRLPEPVLLEDCPDDVARKLRCVLGVMRIRGRQ